MHYLVTAVSVQPHRLKSSSLWGKMASVMPQRRRAVPREYPGIIQAPGSAFLSVKTFVNHMFKRLPPPRPDIIIHL